MADDQVRRRDHHSRKQRRHDAGHHRGTEQTTAAGPLPAAGGRCINLARRCGPRGPVAHTGAGPVGRRTPGADRLRVILHQFHVTRGPPGETVSLRSQSIAATQSCSSASSRPRGRPSRPPARRGRPRRDQPQRPRPWRHCLRRTGQRRMGHRNKDHYVPGHQVGPQQLRARLSVIGLAMLRTPPRGWKATMRLRSGQIHLSSCDVRNW
jgi:hypothetical protein